MGIHDVNICISKGGDDIKSEKPTTNLKKNQYRIRLSDKEVELLNLCAKETNMTKADVIRKGISMVYEDTQK